MGDYRVRLVTYAWGRTYIDRMLDFPLSSVLAPGNLPALAREFGCEVAIVTEEAEFEYLRSHRVVRELERICPVKLVSLDDLIAEPWQYGISLAYALFRGMTAELDGPITETYFLFLNGDFVLADGSYERLVPHIHAGHRALLSPSYCANEEAVVPELERGRDGSTGALAIPARRMAGLVLAHRHNTIRAKTVSQEVAHFRYMDQFYWQADPGTLLGFQMPISLVAMRPEAELDDIGAFWDWGIVYDFCPSRTLTVLGDSDEFLMLELREADTHRDAILLGPNDPVDAASRMMGYITQYQVDNARHPLVLHDRDVPDLAAALRGLEAYRDALIAHLPKRPIDHRGHSQWTYHHRHLFRFPVDARREYTRLRGELRKLEARRLDVQKQIDAIAGQHDAPPLPQEDALGPRDTGAVATLYRRAFGRLPRPRVWHPLYLAYREVALALEVASAEGLTVLLVSAPREALSRSADTLPRGSERVSPHDFDSMERLRSEGRRFGACMIEWEAGTLEDLGEVLRKAESLIDARARISIHCVNHYGLPVDVWAHGIARAALETPRNVEIIATGSLPGFLAVRCTRLLQAGRRLGRGGAIAVAAIALVTGAGFALLAWLVEPRRQGFHGRPRRSCTSVTLTLGPEAGESAA